VRCIEKFTDVLQSRRKMPWKLPLQSEKLGYGTTFIGELSLPGGTAILILLSFALIMTIRPA